MVNGKGSDVPPFGGGFTMAIRNTPAVATSLFKIVIWSEVLLAKAVGRVELLTVPTEVATKFLPVTSRLNPIEPAKTPEGESEVIDGIGLDTGLIMKVSGGWLVPPPGVGVKIVMEAVPGIWTNSAGMVTCI